MNGPVRQPCDEGLIRSTPALSECGRRAEPWVLAATIIGSSMAFIDGTVVNIALPVLQGDFGTSVAGVQWVVEIYALLLAALLLPGGSLGDRYGRRRIFASGIALFAAASAWCGLAPSIGQLVLARAVQGVGAAVLVPSSLALLGTSFAPEKRGAAIGTWSAFSAMTMALGPVLGGWFVQSMSWRAVFYINVPLGAAVIAILYWRVPESRAEGGSATPDWIGVALVALGLGGVVYGLIESSNRGILHPAVIGSLVGGGIALAAFLLVESRIRSPMLPLGLFRSRLFTGANLLTLLLYGALSGALFLLPFNLLQVQGYSATATGAALLPFSAIMFLLSRWSGGLADRIGVRIPLVVGPFLAALGIALFARPGIGGPYWTTFFPAVAVLGLGMVITVTPLTTSVLGAVAAKDTGIASGINNAVSRVAGLLAIALLGFFMLGAFGSTLHLRLIQGGTPEPIAREVMAGRSKLAALEIPTAAGADLHASIRRAIDDAFVVGFRRVMWICSGMAAAGAAIAWILITDSPRKRRPTRPQRRSGHAPSMRSTQGARHSGAGKGFEQDATSRAMRPSRIEKRKPHGYGSPSP